MPPEALTPIFVPDTARLIRATSSAVAPPGPKPVAVLTKSARAASCKAAARFLIVVEQRCFENHFADRAAVHCGVDDGSDVAIDDVILAALERADVDDHVDFGRAIANRTARFERFGFAHVRPEWKADYRANFDRGTAEQTRAVPHVVWIDAHGSEAELFCFLAQLGDLIDSCIGTQERVVDVFCDFLGHGRPAATMRDAIGTEVDEAFDERGIDVRAAFAETARLGASVFAMAAGAAHQLRDAVGYALQICFG